MNKILLAIMALTHVLAFGTKTAHAQHEQIQTVSLDTAIWNTTGILSEKFGRGTSIAVLSMGAGSLKMSDYLIDMMIVAFENTGEFTVMDRAPLDLLAQGTSFPTDREAEAGKARSIGRLLDVDVIVTGAFEPVWEFHRFRVRVIQVRTADILNLEPVYVQSDNIIGLLLGQATKNYFTGLQRLGTIFLNLLPGLGSFAIMNDAFGGLIQLTLGAMGLTMLLAGQEATAGWHDGLISGGIILMGIQLAFNIFRSSSHMRHVPITLEVDPDLLNINAAASGNGVGRISLFYTMRF